MGKVIKGDFGIATKEAIPKDVSLSHGSALADARESLRKKREATEQPRPSSTGRDSRFWRFPSR